MKTLRRTCLLLILFLAFAAQPALAAKIVDAKLIAAQTAVVPGQNTEIGIQLNIPTGWHIYGPVTGDVGLPTRLDWHLPPSFIISTVNWPEEEKFKFQGTAGHGYKGKILLGALLTPPDNIKVGDSADIGAHVEWLVCKDTCVPENADLFLQLPVGKSADRSGDAGLFDAANNEALNPITLASAMLLALIGGVILNLMPCVFPILSMKAFALIQKSQYEHRRDVVKGGWIYLAGVLCSFWLLAGILIVLRWAGISVGWGLQLQSPAFILLLAGALVIIGLMLSDVIRFKSSLFAHFGDVLTHRPSFWGPFFTGVLAVLVATPCTAPFMGGAMFFAFTQSPIVTLLVFTALGIGMAAPFLLLILYPPILRMLPKPGHWMVTFKQILAVPMYMAAGWLVWVFVQQTQIIPHHKVKFSEPYSEVRLEELRAEHKPVFVNMTAAWCLTCIFNDKDALSSADVQDAFHQEHITYLVGDWTDRNAEISKFLAEYHRVGVPLYVYFPPIGRPKVLPQILTPRIIENAVGYAPEQ